MQRRGRRLQVEPPPPQPLFKQARRTRGSPAPGQQLALTVGALQEKATGDRIEHDHAADVAPVVLHKALELLQGLVETAALKLLSVSLREQQGLEGCHPGRQEVLALVVDPLLVQPTS